MYFSLVILFWLALLPGIAFSPLHPYSIFFPYCIIGALLFSSACFQAWGDHTLNQIFLIVNFSHSAIVIKENNVVI